MEQGWSSRKYLSLSFDLSHGSEQYDWLRIWLKSKLLETKVFLRTPALVLCEKKEKNLKKWYHNIHGQEYIAYRVRFRTESPEDTAMQLQVWTVKIEIIVAVYPQSKIIHVLKMTTVLSLTYIPIFHNNAEVFGSETQVFQHKSSVQQGHRWTA